MTVEEADAAIAAFRTQSQCATQNLIELGELPIYIRLRGENGLPPPDFAEYSHGRITGAFDAVDRLWNRLALFNDTIERAQRVRDSIWLLGTDEKLGELQHILAGRSIPLSSSQTPLEQRALFTAAQTVRHVTLNDLMSELVRDFDEAKSVLLNVESALHEGAEAAAGIERELSALQKQIETNGSDEMQRMLAVLAERVAVLNTDMRRDPLSFTDQLKTVRADLVRAKETIKQVKQERELISAELNAAAELERNLRETHAQNAAAIAECRRKIERPRGLVQPLDANLIDDAHRWLEKLKAQFNTDFRPLKVALAKFRRSIEAQLKAERESLAANTAPLKRWTEISGRLSALRAKMRARATRGAALDPALEPLATEAETKLNHIPVSLDTAENAVRVYEETLNRMKL